jgi:hypothetical protein
MSSRDPIVAARFARRVVRDGKWRSLPHRDDKQKILAAIAAEARWAALALPPEATELLPALGKDLSQGGCGWCAAAMQRCPEPEPPRTPVLLALLGQPGQDCCQRRWAMAEAIRASAAAEDLAQLTAGGVPVASAIRGLERARKLVSQAGRPGRY